MTSLYQITSTYKNAFRDLSEQLEDVEMDDDAKQQIIVDSLINIQGSFEDKSLNVASYIANLKLELLGVSEVQTRVTKRAKALDKQITWLNEYLLLQLQQMQINTIKNSELVITVRNNPPKVCIVSDELVPEAYKSIVSTIKIDKTAIGADLKLGTEINGCYLSRSQRLEIK